MDIAREIRLVNFIEKNLGRPFAWGQCDCNVFALEMADAVFDTDLAVLIRGRYKTQAGAIRYRRRSRWGSFICLIEEAEFIEGKRGFEQIGDLLLVEVPGKWEEVHIYLGNKVVSILPDGNVHHFSLAEMAGIPYRVWRYK